MSFRYFLSTMGRKTSRLYLCNGLIFVLLFLMIRILIVPIGCALLIWKQQQALSFLPLWRVAIFLSLFAVGIGLNLVWGWKLISGAYKILFSGEHPKED